MSGSAKRYQECSRLIRWWRCRWYIWAAVLWALKCIRWGRSYGDVDGVRFYFWRIIKGEIEIEKMHRYATTEELRSSLKG